MTMTGTVAILNVGAGDTKLTFDPAKPEEVARAAKIVKDMLRRGFVLLIEVGRDDQGPIYRRAHDFDEKTAEYIIAGEVHDDQAEASAPAPAPAPRAGKGKAGRRPKSLRVAASRTSAVAVARTAGG